MAKTAVENKGSVTSKDLYKQTVALRFLHIAPRKVRRIADSIVGLSVSEAEAQLLLESSRPAEPLLKLLRSAIANAKNLKVNSDKLTIESVRVDQGPMLKRYLPRAHGRATPIQKKMSHILLMVKESDKLLPPRFIITPPDKSSKTKGSDKKDKVKRRREEDRETRQERAPKKEGFLKKIFRRKSV
jgi:large subunit ribosomal protein L22